MAKRVFLSAGHGGSDPGACAYGLKEEDINLVIMKKCRDELKRHGVVVICSRTKDENDPVAEEVREANASKADLAVSFHTNAGKGDGSESFCNTKNKEGVKLAKACEKHVERIGQNSRGVKDGTHLYFIKNTNMTAVLCECAFVDNKTDVKIIDTKKEMEAFGVAYAKAILEVLGIKYAEGSFKVKVTVSSLNIRKGPGVTYKKVGEISDRGVYTIVNQKKSITGSVWGELKTSTKENPRWINIDKKYVDKL